MYTGFLNFDLLTLGISVAAIGILSFVVFIQNTRSATNRAFLFVATMTVLYGVMNYTNYQVSDPTVVLWLIRIVIFFAVWHAFSFFHLFFVFPHPQVSYPTWYRWFLIPVVFITSLLTLTPFVFPRLAHVGNIGEVSTPEIGWGAPFFFAVVAGLVLGGIFILLVKTFRARLRERPQFIFVLVGSIVSFGFLLILNLIFPIIFGSVTFVPLSGLSFLPFILLTAYAVIQYRLLDVKIISTEVVAFVLSIVTFSQIVLAENLSERIFTSGVFILVLIFSFILIRGVINEVRQREEIALLAENLKDANEKLKKLDKLKSQFLSIASHDLRSPLTIIRNFISLLLEGAYGKLTPAGQEGLQQVFDRATDMTKSVDTYLNVSRIEQGKMKYDFIEVELLPIVKNAVAAFKTNADKKGLAIHFIASPGLEGVKAKLDVAKVNEILNNLLDNSIKYTPKGSIDVSLEKQGTVARISVKDTGVGMSTETIGRLFQLFSTAENSQRVNVSSTGVGLYITKAHAEAHGGKIWAESDGEGQGSTFILELPLLKA